MPSPKCEHGRQKRRCVACEGCDICEHKKRRSRCKDCGASEFCEHNRRKSNCKECKGGSICLHGKQKNICIECAPNYFCIHKKRKELCVDCKGVSICEHNKKRRYCKDCEGSGICQHKKIEIVKVQLYANIKKIRDFVKSVMVLVIVFMIFKRKDVNFVIKEKTFVKNVEVLLYVNLLGVQLLLIKNLINTVIIVMYIYFQIKIYQETIKQKRNLL